MYINVGKDWTSHSKEQIFPLLLKQVMSDRAELLLWKLMAINLQELKNKQVTKD